MAAQSFTRNHRDHSNDHGFQFEFFCDKCGNGHRSSFKTSAVGVAASVLKAAGAIFGGGMWRAGHGADHVKDALRGPAWDEAFAEATAECRPKFRQCTLCGKWVCPEVCWNAERGLCEDCAPNLTEHAPALQARAAIDQARQKIEQADQIRGADVANAALSLTPCTRCHAPLATGARFCAQCGTPAAAAGPKFCSGCGGALASGARFCPACGVAVTS
ncbi:MAG TPA: zinc ribbon domain-containing protein [Polyangiaceae bacterium]|nr:zinc ribbon domain-containing protein [Polyangiaceae bacterium]